ncbi:MAG: LicD family protein [Oscillospiraceae bacterium]|nr:LicD family protein [Oscillospiraceae bacterium]
MDQIKQKCFDILIEIQRVCTLADIPFFLYAGSLLGAVRHKGFIPWDDDIDVVMMRRDYDRFIVACGKYLDNSRYELQTIDSDPYASNPWMKLHDKNTAFISGIRREGAMEGINVDIFPVDNAPDSEFLLKMRSLIIDKVNFLYQYRFQERSKTATWKMRLFQALISLIPPWNEMKFKKVYDQYLQKYNTKQTENVVYLSNRKYMRKLIPKRCFESTVLLEFEGEMFPAPGGWQEVLTRLYGKDFMKLPPRDQQVTVHGSAVIDTENSWRVYKRGENGYEKI